MQDSNPYRSPDAAVAEMSSGDELAGRGARLGAAIIDIIILIIVMLPIMYLGGYFAMVTDAMQTGKQPGVGTGLMWSAVSLVAFAVIQFFPLNASGQTWGKKMLNIKIVDLQNRKPDMTRLMGIRYLLFYVVGSIPIVGGLIYLVDVLFIFRNDRRCVHDLVAGTKVVHAD